VKGPRRDRPRAQRTASLILIGIGLLIPALSLIPLGSLWLWQNGYLLYWTAFSLLVIGFVYLTQRRLLPPAKAASQEAGQGDAGAPVEPEPSHDLSPAEEQAWRDVSLLAQRADPAALASSDALLKLGLEAIETVARRLKPGRSDPLWQFTTPEALAIIERVSRRLRVFVLDSVPFGDRLTVAQALTLYRWRGTLDMAERAYDVWRVIRLANPATAAANEAREQLSRAIADWGRDAVARRLTEVYVTEIGRAAIDLYGGRLRVRADALASYVSPESAADRDALKQVRAEPLRILIAGQTSAGKSSLVNALAREIKAVTDALPATASFKPYLIEREGFPPAHLIDSPGVTDNPALIGDLTEMADECDLVLWVAAVDRADRETDRKALDALRRHFASRLTRKAPPLVLVATHIDRLRPFGEWDPPYPLATDQREKARTIRDAVAAAAADLGFKADEAVPVSLRDPGQPYNVEQVWERIATVLPHAIGAQLMRCLDDLKDDWSWKSVWSQASGAGRVLAGSFRGRPASDPASQPPLRKTANKEKSHGDDR